MDIKRSARKMGYFEKVSLEQFTKDWKNLYGDVINDIMIKKMYDDINLPIRSTENSAGYDFSTPFGFIMNAGDSIVIPTGIRVLIDNDGYLALHPRSGLGFKNRLMLANTTGIIDSDYSKAKNEGHIMVKLCYEGICNKQQINICHDKEPLKFIIYQSSNNVGPLELNKGDRFCQGIFNVYGITDDDIATGKRLDGFGSTGN